MLESEIKDALRHISNRKAAGSDYIPIELLKAGGEETVKVLTNMCNCVWKKKEWPSDWKKSVYVPIYKKGDKKECGNYRTIALISHASKVLLRVLQKRLEVFLIPELPIEQAGFRRGRGTRDHIANLRWMMERAREHQRDLYMCFIDYKKAFDCVDHERMWIILKDMGVPIHLVVLLRNLYANQKATVRTEFGETEQFDIGKGVRQGCILSPLLFNIYAENIMRDVLDKWEGGVGIGGRLITNLRYADDTTLIAGTKEDLTEIMESKENKRESRPISDCFKDKGHDYWRYWRGGSGRKNRGGGKKNCISRSIDHQRWTMRQRDTQKNCNGKSRNGRTNNSMERQRDYASD